MRETAYNLSAPSATTTWRTHAVLAEFESSSGQDSVGVV
jgi:hypothetical protein